MGVIKKYHQDPIDRSIRDGLRHRGIIEKPTILKNNALNIVHNPSEGDAAHATQQPAAMPPTPHAEGPPVRRDREEHHAGGFASRSCLTDCLRLGTKCCTRVGATTCMDTPHLVRLAVSHTFAAV